MHSCYKIVSRSKGLFLSVFCLPLQEKYNMNNSENKNIRTSTPAFKLPIAQSIPQELKDLKQWVLWRYRQRGRKDKLTKIPYQVKPWNTGAKEAKTNNPETWGNFEDAFSVLNNDYLRGKYDGLGFVFSENDSYVGVDIDHVYNPETGTLNLESLEEVNKLNSYSEYSPSRTGAHAIIRGNKPSERCRAGNWEMYEAGRYFTFTGDRIEGTPEDINEAPEALKDLYNRRIRKDEEETHTATQEKGRKDQAAERERADCDIITRCSEKAGKFTSLFNMQWEEVKKAFPEYPSQSEADQALLTLIADETRDAKQIIRVFKESARYRPEKGEDYLKRSSDNALSHVIRAQKERELNPDRNLHPFYITQRGVVHISDKGEEKVIIRTKTEITGISDNLDIDLSDTENNRFTHYRVHSGSSVMFPSHGELLTRAGVVNMISSGMMATEGDSKLINSFFLRDMEHALSECEMLKVCNKPGWKRSKTFFVSGDMAYSEEGGQPVNLLDAHSKAMYDKNGTLEGWMHPSVLKWIGYDTARFCCYIAVSGFLSSFLGLPNTIASIIGRTTGGKTTCAMCAGSLIGRVFEGKYIVRSANITMTAAEKLSISVDGHFIVFDETKTGKNYEPLIYMLANGRARGRAPDSKLEEAEGFSASYIFTGESDLLTETVAQGANGRLISIRNKIEKSAENAELAKDIEDIVQKDYGQVKELFIKKMMENKQDLQSNYRKLAAEFRDEDKDIGARIGDTLACVCLAGELLEEVFEDIGVPAKDCKALCKDVMKENITSDQKKEYWLRGLEIVYNEVSTWQNLKDIEGGIKETLIYRNTIGGKDTADYLNVSEAAIKKICQDNSLDKTELVKVWKEKGVTVAENTTTDGKERYSKNIKIEGKAVKCVSFKKEALEEQLGIKLKGKWGDLESEKK